jgi:hypothetical protein
MGGQQGVGETEKMSEGVSRHMGSGMRQEGAGKVNVMAGDGESIMGWQGRESGMAEAGGAPGCGVLMGAGGDEEGAHEGRVSYGAGGQKGMQARWEKRGWR